MPVRVTQNPVETSVQPDTGKTRVTQVGVETSVQPSTGAVRVSQITIETSKQWLWEGNVAGTLRHITADLSGTVTGNFTGTITGTLGRVTCTASGSVGTADSFTGTIAGTLRHVTAAITGKLNESGTIAGTLRHVTAAISGEVASTINATLPKITASLTGNLGYSGSISSTLPKLSASLTGTALYRYGTIAATLPNLSATLTGTVLGKAYLTHDLFWKYKADDLKVSWVKRYHGSRQVQVSRRVPPGAVDQSFAAVFTEASVVSLTLYSSQDVTVQVNAQTFNITKNQPLMWTSDSLEDYPFDADVSEILVSNASTLAARFTVSVLILDERIG
jgi:hypothetical protein